MSDGSTPTPATPEAEERLLTYDECAEIVNMSPESVRLAAQRGEIEIVQFTPRLIRVRASSLRAWIDTRRTRKGAA